MDSRVHFMIPLTSILTSLSFERSVLEFHELLKLIPFYFSSEITFLNMRNPYIHLGSGHEDYYLLLAVYLSRLWIYPIYINFVSACHSVRLKNLFSIQRSFSINSVPVIKIWSAYSIDINRPSTMLSWILNRKGRIHTGPLSEKSLCKYISQMSYYYCLLSCKLHMFSGL